MPRACSGAFLAIQIVPRCRACPVDHASPPKRVLAPIDHGKETEGLATRSPSFRAVAHRGRVGSAEFAQIQESISIEHAEEARGYLELFRSR